MHPDLSKANSSIDALRLANRPITGFEIAMGMNHPAWPFICEVNAAHDDHKWNGMLVETILDSDDCFVRDRWTKEPLEKANASP